MVHRVDDVGVGLPPDEDNDGGLAVGVARIAEVFDRIHRLPYIADAHCGVVAVSDDQRPIFDRLEQLVVGVDLEHAAAA